MIETAHRHPHQAWAVLGAALLLAVAPGCAKKPGQVTAQPEEIRQALQSALAVAGTCTPKTVTEYLGLSSMTYLSWEVELKVSNGSPFDLALGKSLFLVEANPEGAVFDGVAVLRGEPPRTGDPMASRTDLVGRYGLSNSDVHYADGQWFRQRGSTVLFQLNPARGAEHDKDKETEANGFGSLPHGAEQPFKLTLEEGTWVKDETRASVRVVFPELEVTTVRGPERFRVVAYCQRPVAPQTAWTVSRTELIHVAREELARLVEVPETNLVTRVFAANWLVQADAAAAGEVLARVAQPLQQGELLATSLALLTELKRPDVADHALTLLDDTQAPNGIRRLSAVYLGTVKYEKAFKSLVTAAKGDDEAVADGAILGLGAWGGTTAGEALVALLRDDRFTNRHSDIAKALASSGGTFASSSLQKLATEGNDAAFSALVAAGFPDSYDFFLARLHNNKSGERRDELIRGLRRSGGEKALPVLLEMLPKEQPPDRDNPTSTSVLVDELVALDAEPALPELTRMAGTGNLRALQVLAGSKREAARAALTQTAAAARGPALRIALNGLAQGWPKQSVEVFAGRLGDADAEVAKLAIEGLADTGDTGQVPRLLPFLKHSDEGVRHGAADAVARLGVGDQAPAVVTALLETTDENVARPLVDALIGAKWQDAAAVPKLTAKLKTAKDDLRFQVIRLLRHLSGDAMGPDGYSQFAEKPEEWVAKWSEWAAKR